MLKSFLEDEIRIARRMLARGKAFTYAKSLKIIFDAPSAFCAFAMATVSSRERNSVGRHASKISENTTLALSYTD